MNHRRKDTIDAPGLVYTSRGGLGEPRRYDAHPEVSHFAATASITDFDQDGFANEFIVFHQMCNRNQPNCTGQSRGTVYKWDATSDGFAKIWVSDPFASGTQVVSSVSGDFNGDGLTDIAILTKTKKKGGEIHFWHSSGNPEQLLGNSTTTILPIPKDCTPRHSLRAADFDLNGMLDLFVLCKQGTHQIFQQQQQQQELSSSSGAAMSWSTLDATALGPLGNPKENMASTQAFFERCFWENDDESSPKQQCESDANELALLKGMHFIEFGKVRYSGVTLFDYNNDGFVDLFLALTGGLNVLFENRGVPGNKFVSFRLKGTYSNPDGIGAIVQLTWKNAVDTEEKIQLREHNAQSFETDSYGSRDSRIVFGLGKTGVPLKVVVRWPSGRVSTLTEEMLGDAPMTMNYNEIMTITEP